MNDGLRTDMFLRYRAETIACACIFLACRTVESPVVLPSEPRPWYELFDSSGDDVRTIALMLTKLYTMPKVRCKSFVSGIFFCLGPGFDTPEFSR